MADTTVSATALPPDEAIAFLRAKVNVTSERWTDIWQEAHSRAFAVAGAASQALVQDFRAAVQGAIEQGTTLAEFRKQFDGIVAKHGWTHNGSAAWRSRIIYETNLSTAYSAGRYAQMTEPDTLRVYPYWQYMHTSSARPRPLHLGWVGTTLPADDAWWGTHYPPNGWRCKCWVRPISQAGLARMGKSGPDQAPPLNLRPYQLREGPGRPAQVVQVPDGIDPGFAYNPGAAWQRGTPPPIGGTSPASPPAVPRPGRMPPAEAVSPPAPIAARELPMAAPVTAKLPPGPLVTDAELSAWLARPAGNLAVAVVPEAAQAAIGGQRGITLLSPDTIEKQRHHHPELVDADYAAMVQALAAPTVVLRDRARHAVLLRRVGRLLCVVVKTTRPGDENYVVSVRYAGRQDLGRLLRRGTLVYGDPDDLAEPEE